MIYLGIGILVFIVLVKLLITRDFFAKLSAACIICSIALFVVEKVMEMSILFTLAKVSFCIAVVAMAISFLIHLFDLD